MDTSSIVFIAALARAAAGGVRFCLLQINASVLTQTDAATGVLTCLEKLKNKEDIGCPAAVPLNASQPLTRRRLTVATVATAAAEREKGGAASRRPRAAAGGSVSA